MPSELISPIESLGLAGATLDSRVRKAASHISDLTYVGIAQNLLADAVANQMTYERDGKFEPIPIMLRPLLAMNDQLAYVHLVCLRLTEALKRLPSLYLNDENVRRIIPITPDEERWLRDTWTPAHHRNNTVYGRLDAVCDFTAASWQDTLHFMEANLSGVGGISYSPTAEQLVMRDIVPSLVAHDPHLRIDLPRDQRDLFVQVLIDHARAIGRNDCRLCFVEPKYAEEGINEQEVLSKLLATRHGLTITHADPTELHVKGDDVFYEDTCVDVAYRDYEVRDLIELEEEIGKPLDGMRMLFKKNRVVSSLVGDFDHKSCWEILTDEAIAEKYFSAEECRLFRRHVLWTRIVSERKTTLPHNVEGDLLEFARTHREELVMKPNRSYGGEGVTIGAATSQAEWEALLDEAVECADDCEEAWVLQKATRLPVAEFPVVGQDGRVFSEPYYHVMGFAPTENGLGIMCRVSQKQVVNVAQHGGMAAVLIGHPPHELKMPKRPVVHAEKVEETLRKQITELQHLDHAIAVLEWDEETSLPASGHDQRGEQLAILECLRHGMLTSDHLGDLIEEVARRNEGDERWTRELELLRDQRVGEISLPKDLVRRFAEVKSRAQGAWEEARDESDFEIFAPALDEMLVVLKDTAQALDSEADPYDILMDEYEPGMTRAKLEPVLQELRDKLSPLVAGAQKKANGNDPLAARKFSEDKHWTLARKALEAVGFDFERGRLDKAVHAGTSAVGFDDVRVALSVKDDLTRTILTTMHEAGHALYDQGYAEADRGTLLAEAPSMGLHEGLARLWENHVGRSADFWQFFFPTIRDVLGQEADGLDDGLFYRAANRIAPGVNRAGADELSYHLHIILRYEIEVALLSGALKVKDLPAAWNEKAKALIGVVPSSASEGVLQDGHWASGMFGYFPTYTVGSLYAAQLVEAYERDHRLSAEIARGEFKALNAWLSEKIYAFGDRVTADEVIERATGTGLDTAAYFRRVDARLKA
ncbi:MAG: hypothetical protein GC190_06865 [Alphaproteobacteria bacterium]|nr:hypothetical protein [Alphaproteobacteria bacterium]